MNVSPLVSVSSLSTTLSGLGSDESSCLVRVSPLTLLCHVCPLGFWIPTLPLGSIVPKWPGVPSAGGSTGMQAKLWARKWIFRDYGGKCLGQGLAWLSLVPAKPPGMQAELRGGDGTQNMGCN